MKSSYASKPDAAETIVLAWKWPEPSTKPRQARRYLRKLLRIPVQLQGEQTDELSHTHDFGPGGLRLISNTMFPVGSFIGLQFSFADICYLNIAGQVVYALPPTASGLRQALVGIKFLAIKDWEQIILLSALKEIKDRTEIRQKSILTIVARGEVRPLDTAPTSKKSSITLSDDFLDTSSSASSVIRSKKAGKKRGLIFTPDPSWVKQMNKELEPYREAIWQCKLVQETSNGCLSLQQVRGWSIQFYPFVEQFPQFMAVYLSKAPDAMSKSFLIDNLRVEKRHAQQWIDMAKGFGVSTEELFNTPIVPEVEALTHWMWSITGRSSFVEAVSAVNYAIEGVTQGIASIMVKGFHKYHGKDGVSLDKKAYSWMEAHSTYDDLHPFEALEIIKLQAPSVDLQQKVQHAARRSLEYLFRALEGCYASYATEPTLRTTTHA